MTDIKLTRNEKKYLENEVKNVRWWNDKEIDENTLRKERNVLLAGRILEMYIPLRDTQNQDVVDRLYDLLDEIAECGDPADVE